MQHFSKFGLCVIGVIVLASCATNKVDQELANCNTGETCFRTGKNLYSLNHSNERALKFLGKACDLKHKDGCDWSGFINYKGIGVPRNLRAAFYYDNEGCKLGSLSSCYRLGRQFQAGEIVENDNKRAIELFEKVCDGDVYTGCVELGEIYMKGFGEQGQRKALKYQEKACKLKDPNSCTGLAILYEKGEIVKQNISKAIEFYRRACDLKEGIACAKLREFQKVNSSKGLANLQNKHKRSTDINPGVASAVGNIVGGHQMDSCSSAICVKGDYLTTRREQHDTTLLFLLRNKKKLVQMRDGTLRGSLLLVAKKGSYLDARAGTRTTEVILRLDCGRMRYAIEGLKNYTGYFRQGKLIHSESSPTPLRYESALNREGSSDLSAGGMALRMACTKGLEMQK